MNQAYHAHIYFDEFQYLIAKSVYSQIESLNLKRVKLGKMHLTTVGPHSLPMFTAIFDAGVKNEFITFLNQNRSGLSILIHEDTGNDFEDHTHRVHWLGLPLQINFDHFERIKDEKSFLVFPE